ncbi:hypothetical protein CC85DRAFT_301603 [Cutaneotrichosporon oleaginosum]|uniref:Uncharacterized protein n=1 Tax=Cutaneotrichosporon oleaginosum TaxID=879819 RepID=A0A0J1B653_9TREE|nr:uncharacterized protein CC85DRAFT_301603 [Cutaneotrichosporon oleaginosum]KLT43204.1 hypothetical protein CC85DRAFT_301603 [Cutaneotrichosporon oleaginosum]TXT09886.1 hypothetical protein COLE_03820 [Cutaneotrichosporon oleaginosum]
MAALSLTNQQLEKEKRQLCAKVKDTEARLKQTLEKELEQEKTLRTKEKSLQRLRSALDKVQANSKHLRSLHASAKEAINGSICGAREDLNTIKSEAETSRQATEKALEGLNLIRIRIKSLSDSANLSTGLYETRLQELKIKCMDSEQRLEAEKAHWWAVNATY